MKQDIQNRSCFLRLGTEVSIVIITTVVLGCSQRSDESKYYPGVTTSRQSLDQALNAWLSNEDRSTEVSGKPAVRIVDPARQAGQKLARYEVVTESTGTNPSQFTVRLHLEPGGATEVNYVVVGNDPIWVFREDEYSRRQGM
jgi:hypothetical protein